MYHVNPATGNPGLCRAERMCPFGQAQHFDTKAEAQAHFEASMQTFAASLKTKPVKREVWKTGPYRAIASRYRGFNERSLSTALCPSGCALDDLTHSLILHGRPAPCPGCSQRLNRAALKFALTNEALRMMKVEGASRVSVFHATFDRRWKLGENHARPFIHVGTEQAAWDRALTMFARESPDRAVVTVYELEVSPEAQQGRKLKDSGGSARLEQSGTLDRDYYPYTNRHEHAGSTSALVRRTCLRIRAQRPLRLGELKKSASLYNVLNRSTARALAEELKQAGFR